MCLGTSFEYLWPMDYPGVPDTVFTEQSGVIKVSQVVNAARCIWRPTPLADVGIDGQIEHVHNNVATARIVFVQVKSGASYFPSDGSLPTYFPSTKHANYWERADLPVILVLHKPETDMTYWADARNHLRAYGRTPIPVTKVFDAGGVLNALSADGPLPSAPRSSEDLLADMFASAHSGFGVEIDFFDLFFQGLVDMGRGLYFGMDLIEYVAQMKLVNGFGSHFGLGQAEYDFVDRYVDFLLKNDLVRFNFDWYYRHLEHDQIVGQIFGPLTPRGREFADSVANLDSRGAGYEKVVQARAVSMEFGLDFDGRRTSHLERFKTALQMQAPQNNA